MEHTRRVPGEDPGPDHVEAELSHIHERTVRPVVYASRYAQGGELSALELTRKRVLIANLRRRREPPTLETEGFALERHRSALTEFDNDAAIEASYYPEAALLLQRVTGAARVIVLWHMRRGDGASLRHPHESGPVRIAHNDETRSSGAARVHETLSSSDIARHLVGGFALVHVVRPIGGRVLTAPLALCDGRSIQPRDLVRADVLSPHKLGELYLLRASAEHRWSYVHALHPDELLLIKVYDSRPHAATPLCAHSAFDPVPAPPADAPHQRTIELRALLCY
jgi:hypothetical protein